MTAAPRFAFLERDDLVCYFSDRERLASSRLVTSFLIEERIWLDVTAHGPIGSGDWSRADDVKPSMLTPLIPAEDIAAIVAATIAHYRRAK